MKERQFNCLPLQNNYFPYHMSWVIAQSVFPFQNNFKNLDPSYKMVLDLWDCLQHTFVSPSAFSRRAVVSYWRKYVHEVLVNRLGGLSLPRKSVVRLTDRPDMTLDVYRVRKTTMQQLWDCLVRVKLIAKFIGLI